MRKILMLAIWLMLCPQIVLASEVSEYLNMLDMQAVEITIGGGNYSQNLTFKQVVEKAIRGELDLSPQNIIKSGLQILFDELYQNGALMRNLLIVGILSALLKNLTDSFKNKEVGEMGFFVCYIVLIIILLTTFGVTVGIMQELINNLILLMEASIPLMLSLMVMAGSVAGAYTFHPILFFTIEIAGTIIGKVIVPVIMLASGIQIVNHLTEKEILGKFSNFIKKFCEWSLKVIIFLFLSALSLQRISAPIINNLAIKTAKNAAKSVPVVGDILTGAMDSVLAFAEAAKSGVAVAIIIFIALACIIPVIKLVALIIVYKLTAAIIEPVCDERIVECIDSIGSFSFLMLAAGITVVVLFIFAVMILLSF